MTSDINEFRRVMGHFATGVSIVTTKMNGEYHGLTVNSLTSVSLDPLLILVNVSVYADSHDLIKESGVFAVNFLALEQEHLSRRFADPEIEDRFKDLETWEGESGAPILKDNMAYIDCKVWNSVKAGDHTIFIGEVIGHKVVKPEASPLLYYRGNYADIIARSPEDPSKQVPRE